MVSKHSNWQRCTAIVALLQLLIADGIWAATHTVDWTPDGVSQYKGTTLDVQLGDTINFVCASGSYSNLLYLSTKQQFTNCNATYDELITLNNCIGAVKDMTQNVLESSATQGANSAVPYAVGQEFYFTSFAPATCAMAACGLFTAPNNNTDCQSRGLKIAIKVIETPVPATTSTSTSTSTIGSTNSPSITTIGSPSSDGISSSARSSTPQLLVLSISLLILCLLRY